MRGLMLLRVLKMRYAKKRRRIKTDSPSLMVLPTYNNYSSASAIRTVTPSLPRARPIDEAPTWAAVLGARMPQADGRVLQELLAWQ